MSKLSVNAELAWMDWLDAKGDAAKSGLPEDQEEADRRWDLFIAQFVPPELRALSLHVGRAQRLRK